MSGYVVATKRRAHPEPRPEGAVMITVSRRPVATLEEAHLLIARGWDGGQLRQPSALPEVRALITEAGGSITFPDGTVIEVTPA